MTPVWKSVLLFAALTLFGTPLGVALHERSQDRLEIAALKEAIEREKAAHENAQKIAQSVVDSFVRQGHADNEIRKLETEEFNQERAKREQEIATLGERIAQLRKDRDAAKKDRDETRAALIAEREKVASLEKQLAEARLGKVTSVHEAVGQLLDRVRRPPSTDNQRDESVCHGRGEAPGCPKK